MSVALFSQSLPHAITSFIKCLICRAKISFWFMAWMVRSSRVGCFDLLILSLQSLGQVHSRCSINVKWNCIWRLLLMSALVQHMSHDKS